MPEPISSRLNGACNYSPETIEKEHIIVVALKTFGPPIVGALFAILGFLYSADFILKPATKASVDDLKSALASYIDTHNRLDKIREETLKSELTTIGTSLTDMVRRMAENEIRQARIEGILLAKPLQANPPLPAPDPSYDISKAKVKPPALLARPSR